MNSMEYARAVFQSHAQKSGLLTRPAGFVLCEIGPGDSLASALIGRCAGADRVFLVDAGPFATLHVDAYRALADNLRAAGTAVPPDVRFDSIPAYLKSCRATYMTTGLNALRSIDTESVDMIWSHAVLEHVRAGEFDVFVKELYRITKCGGIGSHRVDLRDHLGGALNNLRFSGRVWESSWFASSGFYTNRIQFSRILESFRAAGFDADAPQIDRWPSLPTPRSKLSKEFRRVSEQELLVSSFDLLTSKPTRN